MFTTRYDYDALGNLRRQEEGDGVGTATRVKIFDYDLANRSTGVRYPVFQAVTVDTQGAIGAPQETRVVGEIRYDAAGNRVYERRVDGMEVRYRYDAAYRQVATIDSSGLYAEGC